MGLLVGCVCGIFALLVILLIYSVLLRLAVFVANKCLGDSGGGSRRRDDYEDDWDDYDRPARRRGPAIPEPDLGKGMGIAFVVIIIQFVIVFALALVIGVGMGAAGGGGGGGGFGGGGAKNNPFGPQPGVDPTAQLLLNCFSVILGFLIWSGILTAMLPTSFGRAALVTLFLHIFLFVLWLLVFVGVVAIVGLGAVGMR